MEERQTIMTDEEKVLLDSISQKEIDKYFYPCSVKELNDSQKKWLIRAVMMDRIFKRKPFSKKIRSQVYAKTEGHCYYCGKDIKENEMQVDHIKPFSLNDLSSDISIETVKKEIQLRNELDNLVPACPLCNRFKSNYGLEDFRRCIKHSIKIVRKRKHPLNADNDKIYSLYHLESAKDEDSADVRFYFENENLERNIKDERKEENRQ